MALFRIGSTSPRASGEDRPSLFGGVLVGFIVVWSTSYALSSILGDAAPTKAEGGLLAPTNLLFFLLIECTLGVLAALVTLRMDGPAAVPRFIGVLLFGGVVISVLANDVPGSPVSGWYLMGREMLHALGAYALYRIARRRAAAAGSATAPLSEVDRIIARIGVSSSLDDPAR